MHEELTAAVLRLAGEVHELHTEMQYTRRESHAKLATKDDVLNSGVAIVEALTAEIRGQRDKLTRKLDAAGNELAASVEKNQPVA